MAGIALRITVPSPRGPVLDGTWTRSRVRDEAVDPTMAAPIAPGSTGCTARLRSPAHEGPVRDEPCVLHPENIAIRGPDHVSRTQGGLWCDATGSSGRMSGE